MRYRDIDELRECSTEQLQGFLANIDRTKPSQREFERRVREVLWERGHDLAMITKNDHG